MHQVYACVPPQPRSLTRAPQDTTQRNSTRNVGCTYGNTIDYGFTAESARLHPVGAQYNARRAVAALVHDGEADVEVSVNSGDHITRLASSHIREPTASKRGLAGAVTVQGGA